METEIAKNFLPDGISWWRQVKSGHWLYDNSVWFPIFIVEANWDYYAVDFFEETFHWTESPRLNESGVVYYLVWNDYGFNDSGYLDWRGVPTFHDSVRASMEYAISVMKDPEAVVWDED